MRLILPAGLLAASAALAAVLAVELTAPIGAVEIARAPPGDRAASWTAPPPFTAPPEDGFALINVHSPFSPLRQAVDEPAASDGTLAPPDVMLMGVLVSSGKSIAILRRAGGAGTTDATVGQTINGWRVTRIEADRIVLNAGGNDYEIRLRPGSQPE